ncbi:DUF1015 domain-containing protein [Candidatus Contubernalis alkaliaceticus]|uniref:DUF1015 domain-containing protein n=1 Tax=Candidatus Contubernalis alkaliaceticus TaxID=338645 RepID=UPI001F4BEBF6|nr:DUF1015 domain-containing protein [Candidatus Contubernalis alkalaceticus]UNC91543.1 DUF1015 domain-containing protein [Candidatus Contubernalis alkalaceticus]
MAEIIPFRGIRYNSKIINDLNQVITPPYDVIKEKAQKTYYEKNPYNIIRLEYGLTFTEDDEENNVYSRAKSEFTHWLKQEILISDEQPSFYLYEIDYTVHEKRVTRQGVFACIKVEDFQKKVVLPHEQTMSKPKEDRLNLLRACKANFSPIFGLFPDKEFQLEDIFNNLKEKPEISFQDEEGNHHRLWVIKENSTIELIKKILKDKQIFIADGHHRYETALAYAEEMKSSGNQGYNYILMGLVNLYNPGLMVLPTHRLIKDLADFKLEEFLNILSADFNVSRLSIDYKNKKEAAEKLLSAMEDAGKESHAFGLYGGEKSFYLLTLKDKKAMEKMNLNCSKHWKALDVSVLQVLIFEKYLNIHDDMRERESHLSYERDEISALEAVDSGSYQLAFFMNPTKVDELTNVAGGGERMPQKSTFFYPKLGTGLVLNKLPVNS